MSRFRHVSNRAFDGIDLLDAQIRRLPARWLLGYVAMAAILAIAAACVPVIHETRAISKEDAPDSIHVRPQGASLVSD